MFAAVQLQLRVHDEVRLLTAHDDVRQGSSGRVLGRFARPSKPSYWVAFDGRPAPVEVAADALELHARAS